MDANEERRAVDAVIARLADEFPAAGRGWVEEVVRTEYDALRDRPVRAYIHILVERAARQRLHAAAVGASAAGTAYGAGEESAGRRQSGGRLWLRLHAGTRGPELPGEVRPQHGMAPYRSIT